MASQSVAASSPLNRLECPVCLFVPKKEIYQCKNGHSICHICIAKIAVCPICRVAVDTVKIRNHYAETFLDGMQFACIWKDNGCDAMIARGELSIHETVCKYGTINLCKAFKRSKECPFQFSMMEFNNPGKILKVLNHMESVHKFAVENQVEWNDINGVTFATAQLTRETHSREFPPLFFEVSSDADDTSSKEIFVLLLKLENDNENQTIFSLAFANLTSEKENSNSAATIKVTIHGQKTSEVARNWGDEFIPDLKWTMKPLDAPKLKIYLETQVEDQTPFPFTLPVSHILKHYVGNDDIFTIEFSFHQA